MGTAQCMRCTHTTRWHVYNHHSCPAPHPGTVKKFKGTSTRMHKRNAQTETTKNRNTHMYTHHTARAMTVESTLQYAHTLECMCTQQGIHPHTTQTSITFSKSRQQTLHSMEGHEWLCKGMATLCNVYQRGAQHPQMSLHTCACHHTVTCNTILSTNSQQKNSICAQFACDCCTNVAPPLQQWARCWKCQDCRQIHTVPQQFQINSSQGCRFVGIWIHFQTSVPWKRTQLVDTLDLTHAVHCCSACTARPRRPALLHGVHHRCGAGPPSCVPPWGCFPCHAGQRPYRVLPSHPGTNPD